MATQPTSTETTPEPQQEAESPSIIDETSPATLAQEAAFDRGEDISQPEPTEVDAGAQEVADAGAGTDEVTPEPQATEEQPAETPPAETPAAETPPRTFTQEEWDKRQSSIDRASAEQRQRDEQVLADQQRRIDDFDISARVEAYLQTEITAASTSMGAEDAERFVRNPQRVAQVRQGFEAQKETERLQQRSVQQNATFEQNAKNQVVQGFVQEFKLSPGQSQHLMGMNDPFAMQALAKEFSEGNKTAAVTGSVPAETPATKPGNGTSTTQSQPNPESRKAFLRSKTVLEQTDEEYAEWQRQAVGRG